MAPLSNSELSETSSVYSEGHDLHTNDSRAKVIANPLSNPSEDFSFASSLKPERHDKYAFPAADTASSTSLRSRTHSYSQFTEPREIKSSGDEFASPLSHSSRYHEVATSSSGSGEEHNRIRLRVPSASNNPGVRTSMISQYSGIVHDVDIDTIKYVVDKNSLNESSVAEVKTISSKSKSSKSKSSSSNKSKDLRAANISQLEEEDFADSESITEAVKLPTKKTIPSIDVEKVSKVPDKSESTDLSFTIPPRSPRRPVSYLSESGQIDAFLIDETAKSQVNKVDSDSPSKNIDMSDFKKLPPLPGKTSADNESTRSVSSASKRVSVRIDDIMKEFEDLKSELERAGESDDNHLNSLKNNERDNRLERDLYVRPTITSDSNTRTTTATASFHTADSIDLQDNESVDIQLVNTTDSSAGPVDQYEDSTEYHGDLPTTSSNYHATLNEENEEDYADIDPEIRSTKSKTRQRPTSTGTSNKKKKKQKKHNKMKPFSYDTLAKLLNATDGIVIGQELNELEIPQDEKYLIEQIVDSISRLTASMIVNPTRYNQGCNRLQKVLDVLEGFAG